MDAMLRTLSISQFLELEVWYALQPRGEARADLHAARLLHMFFNMNVTQKDRKPIEDFLLTFTEDEGEKSQQTQTNEDKLWILKLLAMGVGDVKTKN